LPSTKRTTRATVRANARSPAPSCARGKRCRRSFPSSRSSPPSRIAHTPRAVAATSTAPSEHAQVAKRIDSPSPPERKCFGVMPRIVFDSA
jgi:hypothetical protein